MKQLTPPLTAGTIYPKLSPLLSNMEDPGTSATEPSQGQSYQIQHVGLLKRQMETEQAIRAGAVLYKK